jgi:two-component system NarL family response regulator
MQNEPAKIRVLVEDDCPIVRTGMIALLAGQVDIEMVNISRENEADLSAPGMQPHIVLFDFDRSVSGADIAKTFPSAKLVVFSYRQTEEHIYRVIQAGARGYLDKRASLEDILDCIRTVSSGQTWIPPQIAELLAKRIATPELTRREHEVLLQMAQGKSNKQIGVALGLSEGTVKVYMTHILGKFKVGGRLAAVTLATSRGIILQPTLAAQKEAA